MKRVGDLMRELGFREEAPVEVKKAFIKHLVRAAFPDSKLALDGMSATPVSKEPEQLSFSFDSSVDETPPATDDPGALIRRSS